MQPSGPTFLTPRELRMSFALQADMERRRPLTLALGTIHAMHEALATVRDGGVPIAVNYEIEETAFVLATRAFDLLMPERKPEDENDPEYIGAACSVLQYFEVFIPNKAAYVRGVLGRIVQKRVALKRAAAAESAAESSGGGLLVPVPVPVPVPMPVPVPVPHVDEPAPLIVAPTTHDEHDAPAPATPASTSKQPRLDDALETVGEDDIILDLGDDGPDDDAVESAKREFQAAAAAADRHDMPPELLDDYGFDGFFPNAAGAYFVMPVDESSRSAEELAVDARDEGHASRAEAAAMVSCGTAFEFKASHEIVIHEAIV